MCSVHYNFRACLTFGTCRITLCVMLCTVYNHLVYHTFCCKKLELQIVKLAVDTDNNPSLCTTAKCGTCIILLDIRLLRHPNIQILKCGICCNALLFNMLTNYIVAMQFTINIILTCMYAYMSTANQ